MLIGLLFIVGYLYLDKVGVSPDGTVYAAPGPRPSPYSRRWLLPLICGPWVWRWQALSYGSIIATCGLLQAHYGIYEAILFAALPMTRTNVRLPVLTDAPAFLCMLGAATLWPTHPWLAVALSLLAGACKESAPVFAALFAWHPALLLGLLGARWLGPTAPKPAWLVTGLQRHPLDWTALALPWGLTLPLALCYTAQPLRLLAALAVGYGQLLIATDRVRLYQWAALPVILGACQGPEWMLRLACLVGLFIPVRAI